jgi:hypothetical protein
MIKQIGWELLGIVGAIIAWWAVTVLIGLLMYAIFPSTETSFTAGLELKPQNIPGNVAGFIAALYAFRSLTTRRDSGEPKE